MRNPFTSDSPLSLVSAPIVWAAHFVACYVLVSLACAYGFGRVGTGIAVLTLAALGLIGYSTLANWRKWKRMQAREPRPSSSAPGLSSDKTAVDTSRFFALTSAMLGILSAVALIWVAFPAAILPPCAS